MADPIPDRDDEGTPRWVKVSLIGAVAVAALVAIMLLTGHGPWHHLTGGAAMPTMPGMASDKPQAQNGALP